MKYILFNDIINVLKKRWPILISYIIVCFIFSLTLSSNSFDSRSIELFTNYIFGYKIEWPNSMDIITVGMLLLHYGIFILLSVDIFKSDLSNYDNLLERVSLNRWINSKIVVILILSSIINLIIFSFTKILNPSLFITCLFVIKKILIIITIECFVYILIIQFKKNRILFTVLVLITTSILYMKIDIVTFNIIYIISILLIIWSALNMLCYYSKFSDLKG